MAGQIIVVSGTSGSGKSTTCELFAKHSEEFWLLYGIDHFLAATFPSKFGHHGPRCDEGFSAQPLNPSDPDGPLRWQFSDNAVRAFGAFHEWAAAASRQGCNIIFDNFMLLDPPILQDCIWRLQDLPVLFVSLKPPYEVLMERVASRTMDKKLPTADFDIEDPAKKLVEKLNRLRPWFYDAVYANDCYDLEIDTEQHNPEAVCGLIANRLAEGPGTAFQQLRDKYPLSGSGSAG